mgnify:CR=1 FL=1
MEPGVLLRIIVILTGVFLLFVTLSSLAKRRMTEPFVLTWGLISVIIVLGGILLRPTEWNRYISGTGMLLVGMISFCVIFGTYFISARVSELMRKNMELAMQLSLMKQESDEIREQLAELRKAMNKEQSDEVFHLKKEADKRMDAEPESEGGS